MIVLGFYKRKLQTEIPYTSSRVLCKRILYEKYAKWSADYAPPIRLQTSMGESQIIVPDAITRYTLTSGSEITDFFTLLEKQWTMMCDDIEYGTISFAENIPEIYQNKLRKKLIANPQRAQELREIFFEGFQKPVASRIWPEWERFGKKRGSRF